MEETRKAIHAILLKVHRDKISAAQAFAQIAEIVDDDEAWAVAVLLDGDEDDEDDEDDDEDNEEGGFLEEVLNLLPDGDD